MSRTELGIHLVQESRLYINDHGLSETLALNCKRYKLSFKIFNFPKINNDVNNNSNPIGDEAPCSPY